jgi:N-acetylgalactosamine kinase
LSRIIYTRWQTAVRCTKGLINNLKNGVNIETSRIINQGGGYACSTPEIDGLVDLACNTAGVLGAQIAGAGLGGSVIILVESEKASSLIFSLNEKYYKPNGLKCAAQVCSPSAGSSAIKF